VLSIIYIFLIIDKHIVTKIFKISSSSASKYLSLLFVLVSMQVM